MQISVSFCFSFVFTDALINCEIYARGRLDILRFFKRCIIVFPNIAFCGEMVTVKPCENNISHLMHVLCKTIECIMANIYKLLSIPRKIASLLLTDFSKANAYSTK